MTNPEFGPTPEEMGIKQEDEEKVVTETGLTEKELREGVKTEDGEKIHYLKHEEFETIKDARPELQGMLLEKKGISDNDVFDVDVDDERIRYQYDKRLGLSELKRQKIS